MQRGKENKLWPRGNSMRAPFADESDKQVNPCIGHPPGEKKSVPIFHSYEYPPNTSFLPRFLHIMQACPVPVTNCHHPYLFSYSSAQKMQDNQGNATMSWDCVYILSADLSSEFPVASAYFPAQSASFAYSASLQRDLDDERAPFSELLFYYTYYSEEHNYCVIGSNL